MSLTLNNLKNPLRKEDPPMKESPTLNLNEEIEEQLLIGPELEKYNARKFLNLLSDLIVKYESTIYDKFKENRLGA